ncbi:MAG: ATP-binding protein [Candidatus Peribacteria bacterium]|nr:MAG: ATP-binding protein [Candidatus Peribacteria bacterium]
MDYHILLSDIATPNDCAHQLQAYIHDAEVSLTISYTSQFENAKKLREICNTLFNLLNIPSAWKPRLTLIIDELNNNAIEYGSATGEENTISLSYREHELTIEVTDTGHGTKHKTAKQMEELEEANKNKNFTEHHSIRGRGLFLIIIKLVDRLYFKDSASGGLIVGITKKF